MSIRERAPAGAPCWADLWTTDVEGSRRFYGELFGWEPLEPSPEFGGYWMFDRGDAPTAGGMGSMGDMTADDTWKPYFCTRDMDVTLRKAADRGATIRAEAMAVADLGVQAVLTDPAGAVFGLWQPGIFEGFRVVGEHASPSWFELRTRRHAEEVAFYGDLFGYATATDADTDEPRYTTFRDPGSDEDLGGIADSSRSPQGRGDHWDIFWHVDDAVTAAKRVEELGGTVTHGPDRSRDGVLVACADPAGARFGLRARA